MKKLILILIGVIIGIGASFIFALANLPPFCMALDGAIGEAPNVVTYKDLTIIGIDNTYSITCKSNINTSVHIYISPEKELIHFVSTLSNNQDFDLMDDDQDGTFDSWHYGNRETDLGFFYEAPNAHPSKTLNMANQLTSVRIDEIEYSVKNIDNSSFIEIGGKLVEIEKLTKSRYGIKNSEPVN